MRAKLCHALLAAPDRLPEVRESMVTMTTTNQSLRYCDKKVATMLFEALRAALRVVFRRLFSSKLFELIRVVVELIRVVVIFVVVILAWA